MQGFKKFIRFCSSSFFKLCILLIAFVAALVMTFHSPDKIEQSLSDSGVYSTFVDSALKEVQKSNKDSSDSSNIPITDPAIQAAAKQAFTPQLLQTTTENVLNGTYDWLSGKTQQPEFKIDVTSAKQTFANSVGAAAAERVKSLPPCTLAQLQQLTPDIDPFKVVCLPTGYDVTAAQTKVTNDIATSKEFLGTPVITPQNLPKDSNGKTVFDQMASAPDAYKLVNASPWLMAVIALITAGITVFLYESKRRGLRSLAVSLIGVGAFLLFISYVNGRLFDHVNQPGGALGKSLSGSFQQTGIKAANSISHSILSIVLWFGVGYVLAGGAILVVQYFTKPKSKASHHSKDTEHGDGDGNKDDADDMPKPVEPDKPPAPKPRPRPLVQ